MVQNFYYLLSKGKAGVERREVMLIEKLLPSLELKIHTLCKIPKMEKLLKKAILGHLGFWDHLQLYSCAFMTPVLMHLYTYN